MARTALVNLVFVCFVELDINRTDFLSGSIRTNVQTQGGGGTVASQCTKFGATEEIALIEKVDCMICLLLARDVARGTVQSERTNIYIISKSYVTSSELRRDRLHTISNSGSAAKRSRSRNRIVLSIRSVANISQSQLGESAQSSTVPPLKLCASTLSCARTGSRQSFCTGRFSSVVAVRTVHDLVSP